jgi:ketosteroid isomerase-like protein
MSVESESLATVRQFIESYNRGVRHAYEQFVGEEYEWIEVPTAWFPKGRSGGRREVLEAISLSEGTLSDESIEIKFSIASGNTVALEGIWRATVAADTIGAPVGTKIEAHIAQFLRVKSGKITSSHEYVCVAPIQRSER